MSAPSTAESTSSAALDSPSPSVTALWRGVAVVAVLAVLAVLTLWSLHHPHATNWDESTYLNQVRRDAHIFEQDGVAGLVRALRGLKRFAPPAYRIVALPTSLTVGPSTGALRTGSLVLFLLALFLLQRTGALLGSPAAGWAAVALAAVSPDLVRTFPRIYTEPPLVLGVVGSFYFLTRLAIARARGTRRDGVAILGLGAFLALGMLAKMTFPPILAPVLGLALLAAWRGLPGAPHLRDLALTGIWGGLLAGPIYLSNLPSYVRYALGASAGINAPIDGESYADRVGNWLELWLASSFGPAGTLVLFSLALAATWTWWRRPGSGEVAEPSGEVGAVRRAFVLAAVAAALPLLCLQLFWSGNADVRIMAPTAPPLILATLLAAARAGLLRRGAALAVGVLLAGQIALLAWPLTPWPTPAFIDRDRPMLERPVYATYHFPQWDWRALHELLPEDIRRGSPGVLYLGYSSMFNKHQIEAPWALVGEKVKIEPLWNWYSEPWDTLIMGRRLVHADLVLTLPSYQGPFASRNIHNVELPSLVEETGRFEPPRTLRLGEEETEVLVWWRRAPVDPPGDAPSLPAKTTAQPIPWAVRLAIWGYLLSLLLVGGWILRSGKTS